MGDIVSVLRRNLTVILPLQEDADLAKSFALRSKSETTLRSYRSDWQDFERWCFAHGLTPLPASPSTVAAYLSNLARRLRASSITRHVASIGYFHRMAKQESPTTSDLVRVVMAGIRRTLGTAPTRKAPITAEVIWAMLGTVDTGTLRGKRDRALMLLGFSGAFRRSEIVALDVEDLEWTAEGCVVCVRKSKTDQEGRGELVAIPNGSRLRPCEALRAWLESAQITEGPIFRPIARGGQLLPARLTSFTVPTILKGYAKAAGFDPAVFSGHSLRAGFVTSALKTGADVLRIMDTTRHKEVGTLKAYDRRAKAFTDHAGDGFL